MPKFCRQYKYCLENSAQDFSLPDCQFLHSGKLCIDSMPLCVCVCACVYVCVCVRERELKLKLENFIFQGLYFRFI